MFHNIWKNDSLVRRRRRIYLNSIWTIFFLFFFLLKFVTVIAIPRLFVIILIMCFMMDKRLLWFWKECSCSTEKHTSTICRVESTIFFPRKLSIINNLKERLPYYFVFRIYMYNFFFCFVCANSLIVRRELPERIQEHTKKKP